MSMTMRSRDRWWGLVCAAMVVVCPGPRASRAADFEFSKPTPLSQVLAVVARMGRFNVVAGRGTDVALTWEGRGVAPVEALERIAASQGLVARRAGYVIGRETWLVLDPELAGRGFAPVLPRDREARSNVTFRRPSPLAQVLGVVGSLGRFTVELEPGLDPSLALDLKEVNPVDALNLIAQSQGLAVESLSDADGGRRRYRLVRADPVSPVRDQAPALAVPGGDGADGDLAGPGQLPGVLPGQGPSLPPTAVEPALPQGLAPTTVMPTAPPAGAGGAPTTVPPVFFEVSAIVGEDPEYQAVLEYKGASYIVRPGSGVPDEVAADFVVKSIHRTWVEVYDHASRRIVRRAAPGFSLPR